MSFSGYDSEAVGFDSVSFNKEQEKDSFTQTTEFSEISTGTQTYKMNDCGINTTDDDLKLKDFNSTDYSSRLNDFLNRVVPAVLEQLDLNEKEAHLENYGSEDEEINQAIIAKLVQEIVVIKEKSDIAAAGDYYREIILDISHSNSKNSLAISTGKIIHDEWCEHDGIVNIYNTKSIDGKFIFNCDIKEKSCVSVVKFHPTLPLLAYGTVSGDIGIWNMRNINEEGLNMKSLSDESKRISCLYWSDSNLSISLLTLKATSKRRGASDQVLISSGSDGKINVWQVNINLNVFENIICFQINGINKLPPEDITCFDFANQFSKDEANATFVVGTKIGAIFHCTSKSYKQIVGSTAVDPVCNIFNAHSTCIFKLSFNKDKVNIFASVSIDSELRIYDISQKSALKVFVIQQAPSCMEWLFGPMILIGLANIKFQNPLVLLLNIETGEYISLEGILNKSNNDVSVTAMEIIPSGNSTVIIGVSSGIISLWEVPIARKRFIGKDIK